VLHGETGRATRVIRVSGNGHERQDAERHETAGVSRQSRARRVAAATLLFHVV